MDAEDPRALYGRDRQRGEGARVALVDGEAAEGLADEVLVGDGHQDRPAGRDHLVEAAAELQGVVGVLAEVVGGVDEDAVPRDPRGERLPGQIGRVRHHVAHHVVIGVDFARVSPAPWRCLPSSPACSASRTRSSPGPLRAEDGRRRAL